MKNLIKKAEHIEELIEDLEVILKSLIKNRKNPEGLISGRDFVYITGSGLNILTDWLRDGKKLTPRKILKMAKVIGEYLEGKK